jgi:hypothetical protein
MKFFEFWFGAFVLKAIKEFLSCLKVEMGETFQQKILKFRFYLFFLIQTTLMRKISVIIAFLISIHSVLNASTVLPDKIKTPPPAKEVMIPLIGTNTTISLEDFLNLTPASYKIITGKKMSYGQRLDLGISKHSVKK